MCRFTLYLGPPVRLSTLLTEPKHSLIHQSFHSEERREPLNGDGFGVGWYAPRLTRQPAVYNQITPAWNNRNLFSMAQVLTSPCVMAHVRAASPGSDVNLANCHPFAHGEYLLMHNGRVGSFRKIRRALLDGLTDEAFDVVKGSTDTEHVFAVFVDEIVRNGRPTDAVAHRGDGHRDGTGARGLAERLAAALRRVLALTQAQEPRESSFLNVAVSDGRHVAVARYTDDASERPESLYCLHGEMYEPAGRHFPRKRADDEGEAVVVASERLTDDPRWEAVPPNTILALDRRAEPQRIPFGVAGLTA